MCQIKIIDKYICILLLISISIKNKYNILYYYIDGKRIQRFIDLMFEKN